MLTKQGLDPQSVIPNITLLGFPLAELEEAERQAQVQENKATRGKASKAAGAPLERKRTAPPAANPAQPTLRQMWGASQEEKTPAQSQEESAVAQTNAGLDNAAQPANAKPGPSSPPRGRRRTDDTGHLASDEGESPKK